jgi:Protein of unknown function, DUF488
LPTLYTIGHSNRSLEDLAAALDACAVRELVDVRSAPASRRHPHLNGASLARSLPTRGIEYAHEQALGELRGPRPRSPNQGWNDLTLRGYADYMVSERFRSALDRLQERARVHVLCLMCAEAHWRRCHRRLICDALLVRGWRVLHLGLDITPSYHELTPFAVIAGDRTLTYPPLEVGLSGSRVARATSRHVTSSAQTRACRRSNERRRRRDTCI